MSYDPFEFDNTRSKYRRLPTGRGPGFLFVAMIGAAVAVLIGCVVLWGLSQPSAAELRDEADYCDQCDYTAKVTAEFGPLSRPAAEAEYQKARSYRIFSEKYGRRPQCHRGR